MWSSISTCVELSDVPYWSSAAQCCCQVITNVVWYLVSQNMSFWCPALVLLWETSFVLCMSLYCCTVIPGYFGWNCPWCFLNNSYFTKILCKKQPSLQHSLHSSELKWTWTLFWLLSHSSVKLLITHHCSSSLMHSWRGSLISVWKRGYFISSSSFWDLKGGQD